MEALRRDLHDLELNGVEEREEEIDRGSYGKVVIVFYKGLKCAGKILHHELTQYAKSEEKVNLAERFAKECLHMSNARHPNIVLFLGVYFRPQASCDFPILVMEYLPMCLEKCLAKYPNLPPYIKNTIVFDVAKGLQYLHDGDLIHRDLTAKNVLIGDNLRAKITDLGVSTIISADIAGQYRKFTKVPGNAHYMPPEAFAKDDDQKEVKYDKSLDIFSYGILIINTITHTWPNPKGTVHKIREIERRKADLDLMGVCHPLRPLTEQCLNDTPTQRPTISDIISVLEKVMSDNPAPFRNTMELLQDYCRCSEESKKSLVQFNESKEKQLLLERAINQVQNEHEAAVKQISIQDKDIQEMQLLLKTKDQELKVKDSLLTRREERIQAMNTRISVLSQGSKGQVSLFDPTVTLSVDTLSTELCQKRKHAQAVVLNEKMYMGSGYCESDELAHEMAAFCLKTNQWQQLPQSKTRWFAMAAYESELVLISGKHCNGNDCTQVAKLSVENEDCWTWHEDITEMKTARMGASATSIGAHLLVAGGWDHTKNRINTVEVYDKHKRQWFKSQPLPRMAAECKTALVDNDVWIFMGGANQMKAVFYASLQAIVEQAVPNVMERSHQKADEAGGGDHKDKDSEQADQLWKTLPDVPHEFCCAALLGGSLVSIGGIGGMFRNNYSKAIYAYIPHTNAWLKIGDMLDECCKATAVTLNDGSVLILGGIDRNKRLISTMNRISVI